MADKTQLMLIILYEEELRHASALVAKCVTAQGTDDFSQAALDALNACAVALQGMDDKSRHPVLISASKDIVNRVEIKSKKTRKSGATGRSESWADRNINR